MGTAISAFTRLAPISLTACFPNSRRFWRRAAGSMSRPSKRKSRNITRSTASRPSVWKKSATNGARANASTKRLPLTAMPSQNVVLAARPASSASVSFLWMKAAPKPICLNTLRTVMVMAAIPTKPNNSGVRRRARNTVVTSRTAWVTAKEVPIHFRPKWTRSFAAGIKTAGSRVRGGPSVSGACAIHVP